MSVSLKTTEAVKLDLPIPYKSNISDTFNYFASKEEVVKKYIGFDAIISLSFLYLLKKYKSNCVLYDTTKLDTITQIDLGLAIHNTFGVDEEKEEELMELNRKNCTRIAKQINACMKNRSKNKVTVLPVTLIDYNEEGVKDVSTHTNLLLIRFGSNEIEHYEPHGAMAQILESDEEKYEASMILNRIIDEELVATLNSIKGDDGTPHFKLIPTMETCPEEYGMQMLEGWSKLPKTAIDTGLCAIWTLFMAELALKNHNLTAREIIQIINYDVLQFNRKIKKPARRIDFQGKKITAEDYLRKVGRGYVNFINEKLKKYFNDIFGQPMDVEHISEIGETNQDAFDEILYRVDGAIFIENLESVKGKKSDQQLIHLLETEMRKIERKINNPLQTNRLYKRYYYASEYVKNRSGLDRISPVSIFTPSPEHSSHVKSATPSLSSRKSSGYAMLEPSGLIKFQSKTKVKTVKPQFMLYSQPLHQPQLQSLPQSQHTSPKRTTVKIKSKSRSNSKSISKSISNSKNRKSPSSAEYGLSNLFKENTKTRRSNNRKTVKNRIKSPANYGLSNLFSGK